ncbi:MAG: hypothetical protein WCI49_10065, partial [Ferruginibacter sp.]
MLNGNFNSTEFKYRAVKISCIIEQKIDENHREIYVYILRLIKLGVTSSDDISEILGLPKEFVTHVLLYLNGSHIEYQVDNEKSEERINLLEMGENVINTKVFSSIRESTQIYIWDPASNTLLSNFHFEYENNNSKSNLKVVAVGKNELDESMLSSAIKE